MAHSISDTVPGTNDARIALFVWIVMTNYGTIADNSRSAKSFVLRLGLVI